LKAGSERALAVIKGDNDKRIAELQAQFKEDLLKLDGLRKDAVASADKYKAKLHKAQTQLGELKEVLQMAVDADARKDALVEEVRASAKEAREKLDKERDGVMKEKEFVARE